MVWKTKGIIREGSRLVVIEGREITIENTSCDFVTVILYKNDFPVLIDNDMSPRSTMKVLRKNYNLKGYTRMEARAYKGSRIISSLSNSFEII